MIQVTIHLDDRSEALAKRAAKAARIPLSRWIAGLVKQAAESEWPASVLELAGSWANDDDVPLAETMRRKQPADVRRRKIWPR